MNTGKLTINGVNISEIIIVYTHKQCLHRNAGPAYIGEKILYRFYNKSYNTTNSPTDIHNNLIIYAKFDKFYRSDGGATYISATKVFFY